MDLDVDSLLEEVESLLAMNSLALKGASQNLDEQQQSTRKFTFDSNQLDIPSTPQNNTNQGIAELPLLLSTPYFQPSGTTDKELSHTDITRRGSDAKTKAELEELRVFPPLKQLPKHNKHAYTFPHPLISAPP